MCLESHRVAGTVKEPLDVVVDGQQVPPDSSMGPAAVDMAIPVVHCAASSAQA